MERRLPCSVSVMRILLLTFNLLFLIISLALIGIGIYIKIDNKFSAVLNKLSDESNFEGQSLGYFGFILIGGGIFIFLVSLIACIGMLRSSKCLLYIYASILMILMLLQFIGFIMAFAYRSKLENVYKTTLAKVFADALKNNETKVLDSFHDLESSLKCCGVNGSKDYEDQGKLAPPICFEHPQGCSTIIIDFLDKNLPIIGGVLGGVLFLELLALMAVIILIMVLKNSTNDDSTDTREIIPKIISGKRRNYMNFQ